VAQPAAPTSQLMVHRTELHPNSSCPSRAAQSEMLPPLPRCPAGSRTDPQEHPLPGAAGEEGTGRTPPSRCQYLQGEIITTDAKGEEKVPCKESKGLISGSRGGLAFVWLAEVHSPARRSPSPPSEHQPVILRCECFPV